MVCLMVHDTTVIFFVENLLLWRSLLRQNFFLVLHYCHPLIFFILVFVFLNDAHSCGKMPSRMQSEQILRVRKMSIFCLFFRCPPLPSRMLCPNNGIFLSDNETALKCLRNAPRPSRLCVGLQTSLISGARGCNLLTASWQKTCASGQN